MERHHIKFYHHLFTFTDFTELWLMKAKTTSTGQKIVTRQTRIAEPWSSVHSSQQHEILSKSIARRQVAILHLIWQWVLKEDLWDQKILFTDEGGKVGWWQSCLGQNSECSRPGAAGWWRRPSSTTRWSAWTSRWRTARGNRSDGSNVVSTLWGDELWVVLVVREVTRPQNIFTWLLVYCIF